MTIFHRAMQTGARLLVLERVVPPAGMPPAVGFMDLNMHVMEGGRERTAAEFGTLFEAAGFELTRVVALAPSHCLVEGVRT